MLLLAAAFLVAFVLLLYMVSPLISPKPLALPGAHVVVSGLLLLPPVARSPYHRGPRGKDRPAAGASPAAVHPGTAPLGPGARLRDSPSAASGSCPGPKRERRDRGQRQGSWAPGAAADPHEHPWDVAISVLRFPSESVEEQRG